MSSEPPSRTDTRAWVARLWRAMLLSASRTRCSSSPRASGGQGRHDGRRRRTGRSRRRSSTTGAGRPTRAAIPPTRSESWRPGRRPMMKPRISPIERWMASMAVSTRATASSGSAGVDELGDLLQRQAHRVQPLDDAVMQVASDAFALGHHAQGGQAIVEPGVLDGDAGVAGEQLDQALVAVGELGGALLVGQVQVADRPAADRDGHAQERGHGWMVGREAVRVGVRARCPGCAACGPRG